jgi:hypothetical protein
LPDKLAHPALTGWSPRYHLLDLTYAVFGVGALLAALLPRLLSERPLSVPMVFFGLAAALFVLPLGLPDPDSLVHPDVAERLTEVG